MFIRLMDAIPREELNGFGGGGGIVDGKVQYRAHIRLKCGITIIMPDLHTVEMTGTRCIVTFDDEPEVWL